MTTDEYIEGRRASCHYRITWDETTLSWALTYDGQVWATICAYLPGQPARTILGALEWASSVIGVQAWQREGHGYRAVPAEAGAPVNLHTDGNAIPAVDGTELGHVLDQLANIHPVIDFLRDSSRLAATSRLTLDETQTLIAAFAGSSDGANGLNLIGQTIARLTNPDSNPCLRDLPLDQQKTIQLAGESTARHLADDRLHQFASDTSAAITS